MVVMKKEIVRFLQEICTEFGLQANYLTTKGVFVIHKRGLAIQNFNRLQFYQLPMPARRRLIKGILKRGLTHNIGERGMKNHLHINSQVGIRIA